MESTYNRYPIGAQYFHPKSTTASQAIPHDVASTGPPETFIDLTLNTPSEVGLPLIQIVDRVGSCTVPQREQIAAKKGISKKSRRGQATAPSTNTDAPAKIDEAAINTRSGQFSRSFGLTSTPVVTPHRYEAPCSIQLGI